MRILFKERTNLATDFAESSAEKNVPAASLHAAEGMLQNTSFSKNDG